VTQRLYYFDSHLRDFEASVTERAEGGKRIYLDRTAFYPASGGQPSDTGHLNGIEVAEVVDEGERIAHLLVQSLPSAESVRGQLDWPRRFDHMQQHTGQHLLSAVLADLLGYTTASVHMGELSSTLDLDAPQLSAEQIARVEQRANEIVTENRPVGVGFEEAGSAVDLRKASNRSGTIRIITIENLDRSACGGTHVKSTGAVGPILLRKIERVRKGVRLEFLCGLRAIRRSRVEFDILSRAAAELSSSVDELPHLVANQRAELKQAILAGRELEAELSIHRAKQLYAAASPDSTGITRAVVRLPHGAVDDLRPLAQAFTTFTRAVFVGAIESPPSVLLGASADCGLDAGSILKDLLGTAGGRGGGSRTLAQGVVPGRAQLDQIIQSLQGSK
jgi:alanyl-tRNA synthetase